MQEWLISIFVNHPILVYAIIFLVAFIEGPFFSMLCGLILHATGVPFWPLYIALMLGDLVGDVFWYGVGHYAGKIFIDKYGKYFSITEKIVTQVTEVFHKHKEKIIFISKITNGFGFALAVLITAGIVRIPFKRYMYFNALGQIVWTGMLLAIGYFMSSAYTMVDDILSKILMVAGFIVIFFTLVGYGKYLRGKIMNGRV